MAYCANCGNPLGVGQRFCPACGRQTGGEVAGAAAGTGGAISGGAPQAEFVPTQQPQRQWEPPQQVQQAPQPGYQPGWTYYPQGPSSAPPRRSRKGLWIGLTSALLVIAVACVLVFVVFRGDIFGGGGASSPEQAVRQLLSAFEDKDIDAVFDLLDPEALSDVIGGQSVDEAKDSLREEMFEGAGVTSVTFSGVKMSTDETGDDTATVTLTAGKLTVTDENGDKDVSDVTEADSPPTIDLVKREGAWYIDPASMNFVAGTGDGTGTTTTDQGPPSTVTGETTTSEGSTSTTLFTTSTAVGGGSGAKTPQEVVMRFFNAMESKDIAAVIALFDPVALEEVAQGVDIGAFAEMMGESLFTYESVEFSGIEVDVDFQDEANAIVTVTAGTATITESDGTTSSEDIQDAEEPFVFTVVQRDDYWYADPSMFDMGQ